MAAPRIGGVTFIKVDGVNFAIGEAVTVSLDRVERTTKTGASGVAGFSEMPRAPFIEVEVYKTPDISLEELQAITDATVVVNAPDGSVYGLRNAYTTTPRDLDVIEGKTTVRFEGLDSFEVTPTV